MSHCTVFYTGFHQVILTNINSILTLLFTNTKCYWIVLNIRADRHLYGHKNKLNPISLSNWYFGGLGRTWTCDRTIMSPYTVFYTGFHQVILTNIYSILSLPITYTKCYWISLNFRADRHLYGHLNLRSWFLYRICWFLCGGCLTVKN